MSPADARAVIDQLADPTYLGMFQDALTKRAAAQDNAEEPAARELYGQQAEGMFAELADAVAAEIPTRELVTA